MQICSIPQCKQYRVLGPHLVNGKSVVGADLQVKPVLQPWHVESLQLVLKVISTMHLHILN